MVAEQALVRQLGQVVDNVSTLRHSQLLHKEEFRMSIT